MGTHRILYRVLWGLVGRLFAHPLEQRGTSWEVPRAPSQERHVAKLRFPASAFPLI